MWFTDAYHNQIGRIAADGTVARYDVPTPNSGLGSIALGCACDASLWFTEKNANKIGRISTSTGAIGEITVPTPNAGLGDIIDCFDGALWFAETHAIGSASAPVPLP
jgi:virginiamycin B lyase